LAQHPQKKIKNEKVKALGQSHNGNAEISSLGLGIYIGYKSVIKAKDMG